MNVVQPGGAVDAETKGRLIEEYGTASGKLIEKQSAQPDMSFQTVVDMFMPRNLVGAIAGHDRAALGEVLADDEARLVAVRDAAGGGKRPVEGGGVV